MSFGHRNLLEMVHESGLIAGSLNFSILINQLKILPVEELRVDTSDLQSLARLGDEYFESSNYEQAIEIYKKILENNPDDADTY